MAAAVSCRGVAAAIDSPETASGKPGHAPGGEDHRPDGDGRIQEEGLREELEQTR
jgi:hypothetical protein